MTQRYKTVHLLAGTGYLVSGDMQMVDDTEPMRWDWAGEGMGAGKLTVHGSDIYVAQVLNAFQHQPILRYCTRAVGVDRGELDTGVIT